VLGFGIGPKSSTVPVYAAECAPAPIRGALVMMWQMWTAFGIMLGYVADVAFYKVKSDSISGLNWRLMLASAMVLPLVVCAQVYLCPESPRWYMGKGRYGDVYQSMVRLRHHRIQAARDIFYMHTLLEAEKEMKSGRNRVVEMFTIPRNRRAAQGSWIVMVYSLRNETDFLVHATILWSQCHCVLLLGYIPTWGFLSGLCTTSKHGFRDNQLSIRNPSNLYDRHIWPTQLAFDDFPIDGNVSSIHWIFLLHRT